MKVLLFAGAGTSIELGVPGMSGLADGFLDHTQQWSVEPDLVQEIMKDSRDLEHFIDQLDSFGTAQLPLAVMNQNAVSLERINKVRAEVEWFVQHAVNHVMVKDAKLMWGSVLQATSSHDLTLVTTNYDRAIELAANADNVPLDDGFSPFNQAGTSSWKGFGAKQGSLLVKLHGSTDWYASDAPTKLRHSVSLFGGATLHLSDGQEVHSGLVLPSREKLLNRHPYPRLSQTFLNVADNCEIAIIVGSSLRDPHIHDSAETTASRVPMFVVNPTNRYGLERAHHISQCASTFLIATLPNALLTPDPVATLKAVTMQSEKGTLTLVRQALDTDAPVNVRWRAIEELDSMGTTLHPSLLRELLADKDSSVARYSLGLMSLSADRDMLIEEAKNSPHATDAAFLGDLELLKNMAAQKPGVKLATSATNAQLTGAERLR